MSEQTANPEAAAPPEFDRAKDMARLKSVAGRHFATLMGALTLFAAGDLWAQQSDLLIADFTGLANAIIAGYIMAFLAHEWGHFAGARLSGAMSPVLKEPAGFFMFNFKFEHNTTRQFLWMSLGGPGANWTLVLLIWWLLPMSTPAGLMLLATALGIAVNVTVFEGPIIKNVMGGGEPQAELKTRVQNNAFRASNVPGVAAAAALWLAFV